MKNLLKIKNYKKGVIIESIILENNNLPVFLLNYFKNLMVKMGQNLYHVVS
jgi:hypothetical protein